MAAKSSKQNGSEIDPTRWSEWKDWQRALVWWCEHHGHDTSGLTIQALSYITGRSPRSLLKEIRASKVVGGCSCDVIQGYVFKLRIMQEMEPGVAPLWAPRQTGLVAFRKSRYLVGHNYSKSQKTKFFEQIAASLREWPVREFVSIKGGKGIKKWPGTEKDLAGVIQAARGEISPWNRRVHGVWKHPNSAYSD